MPNAWPCNKDIEYRKVEGKPLRFDFYRLPPAEKPEALPVVILMNGFGDPKMKEQNYQQEWARLLAAAGFCGVTFESHQGGIGEDLDLLVAHLREQQAKLRVGADRIVVHASSGHAFYGLPIFMDKKRTYLKGAVIYFGAGEVKEFRADLPILFVRVGLDQPGLNRDIDKLVARALEVSAPVELISYPGGHHPFEFSDDNDLSRAVIAQTIDFMRKAVSPGVQEAIRATSDEAAAGAALMMENWQAAIDGYGKLVAQRSNDFELHRRYGDALFGAKEYARALQAYEQSYALGHWRKRDISYPAAVASVRANDAAGALKWIERLVNTPFDRASLLTDPNFEALRGNAQFRALAAKNAEMR